MPRRSPRAPRIRPAIHAGVKTSRSALAGDRLFCRLILLSYMTPIWLFARLTRTTGECGMDVSELIDALIEREGGYADHPADKGGPTRFGITEAVARAHGYAGAMRELPREEAAAIYTRLYWLRPRFDEVAQAQRARRRRAARHRRQHGAGGRRHLPSARAHRAQPQRQGLSRPGPRRAHRPDDTDRARLLPPAARQAAAARPSCCARSRRFRASATSASPSAGPPMRRSFTAGSRTGLVSGDCARRHCEHSRTFESGASR